MRTLLLLRHAEAGPKDPEDGDHGRPVTQAGAHSAQTLGRWLAHQGLHPDAVLCSTARRARETLTALGLPCADPEAFRFERELYLASADALLDRLTRVPPGPTTLLVVAHNPSIADLAEWLTATGDPNARDRLRRGFPPAALAVLTLDVPDWSATAPHTAHLARFVDGVDGDVPCELALFPPGSE